MTQRASVVAAVQSPTLLNILAKADGWSLRVCELGDHSGLAESQLLDVPMWQFQVDRDPEIVLVCTPQQLATARTRWPKSRVLWLVHNGRERGLLPADCEDGVAGAVVFSERLRWLCQAGRRPRFHFVSPAYEAVPEWSWKSNELWTLRNRPGTRSDDRDNVIAAITDGYNHTLYGQGQRVPFADDSTKKRLRSSCSAYVSALDRAAGFALAEHEAFAAGVPVIGGWWGDTADELSPLYWALQYDLGAMRRAVERVVADPGAAGELSELGCAYIATYRTQARMNQTVADLISRVL
jgi:glycosyltransferase involved in cell wall biosynthesis